MAKAAGFTCDRPGCNTFAVADGDGRAVPDGWHILFVGGDSKQEHRKELCSDYCLAIFAIERYEVDGSTFKRGGKAAAGRSIEYRRYTEDERREIVRLVREEGKSVPEIAEAFDMKPNAVYGILRRAENA